ncbi:helix-turn-helix transcriptional regulator [Chitinophaga barathri]|uniref:DNA-binding response regulator n=1 Tax=Chitinophaga barathri TaxID=1647451 RepID=A0A3N4MRY4_9BACT|nr:response regulator transcription factor [Chitinophaga barathri]RPD42890.1 DNA-binding response regulator [Chitinophaga barathri]
MRKWLTKHKSTILYTISLAILLFVLRWLELRFLVINNAFEIYAGGIAILFTALGIWLALKLSTPKVNTVVVEKEVFLPRPPEFTVNEKELEKTGLSGRELEVLQLMAEGLSNQEIAAKLYVSLSTIKTHSSKVLEKMDVRRRTQAIDKAKKLNIIP